MRNEKTISIVIFKNKSGKSHSFTLTTKKINTIIGTIIASFILLFIGIYLSYNTNIQQAAYTQLKKETRQQTQQLKSLHENLESIQHTLVNLIEKEESLELLLGKARVKKKKSKKKVKHFKTSLKNTLKSSTSPYQTSKKLGEFLNDYVDLYNEKYSIHLARTHRIKTRFESTPSIRPLYGRLMSRYGWRRHPVTGRKRFHKGIDIASWAGAPIQVTADGLIEYAGWSRTFGYVVVVDHNYGYRTIYAHCSQILVNKREFVKKGQVIAQVGSTGLSTGPHLHYEIRKYRKTLNPIAFLDLDMFTARRRIW